MMPAPSVDEPPRYRRFLSVRYRTPNLSSQSSRSCAGPNIKVLKDKDLEFANSIRPDTVGQPPSTEIGVPSMPALKAKKLRKLPREKVLLEL